MNAVRTTVLLYEMCGLALIVPGSTGVVYRNQTGGHACLQTELEGYLVPVGGDSCAGCERLLSYFTGPKWGGWCSHRIDEETADEIETVLADIPGCGHIMVDRDKFAVSWESWVHVKITAPLLGLVEHDSPVSAVLTWPNSD